MATHVDRAPASDHYPHLHDGEVDHENERDADAEHEVDESSGSGSGSPKPKKKRRVVKTADKKYECPHVDCGKSYSRAEHLYRHQLNHTPKQIYHCDFPGCDRNFVRADLCARHKERHTAKGSHLQRKDAFLNSRRSTSSTSLCGSPSSTTVVSPTPGTANRVFHATSDPFTGQAAIRQPAMSSSDLHVASLADLTPISTTHSLQLDAYPGSYDPYTASVGASQRVPLPASAEDRHYTFDSTFASRPAQQLPNYMQHSSSAMNSMQPSYASVSSSAAGYGYPSPSSTTQNFQSPSSYAPLPSMTTYNYGPNYGNLTKGALSGSSISPPTYTTAEQLPTVSSSTNSIDFSVFDAMGSTYAMPVFGSETPFSRSPPPAVDENFLNMLFTTNGLEMNHPSPSENSNTEAFQLVQDQKLVLPSVDTTQRAGSPSLPSLSQGFDIDIPQSLISEKTQIRLLNLVGGFGEIHANPERRSKADIFAGNSQDPDHVMSLQMLKTYLASFWFHIHQQMPILHRPTFNPETCPDLLLLAMMCLGATCLERTHSLEMTQASAELAFFIAYHMRWELFKDAEFRPPAKLWTFQSMLLLELFEKMFSTRSLHERGHVHHATTLTVMRRGSSLIGRCAVEQPHSGQDPTRTPPGPEGSINTSGQNTPDAWWNRWITTEATRRAAFCAFIADSTHATLFGHSAIMSPHELRLALPCDEALWSATNSAEVQRVEASLAANGFKTPSFLDGLRRTLNGQKVRTNTFGRVILMAGLMNVSWHMNQRDLQVSSLGAPGTLGSSTKWRSPLTRAFDFWRRDFDESTSKNDHWLASCAPGNKEQCPLDHREIVFESRTCLHSLAHMAMHVEMIDCQVFAGSVYAVGRRVTDSDRATVQRRMRDQWAPSARARDAVFYALRFLCEVMIPEEELSMKRSQQQQQQQQQQHPPQPHKPPTFTYSPRHDYLLNRPWVLYFATLIVWSYGYALDGPVLSSSYATALHTREAQVQDMQRFLVRMGGVASPDDLERLTDRNACLGLLLLLRAKFDEPRWELMHEAGEILGSCIELLRPGHVRGQGQDRAKA